MIKLPRSTSEAGLAVVVVEGIEGKELQSCWKLSRLRRSGTANMVSREKDDQGRRLRISHQKCVLSARPVGKVSWRTRFTGCVDCVRYVSKLEVATAARLGGGEVEEGREIVLRSIGMSYVPSMLMNGVSMLGIWCVNDCNDGMYVIGESV